MATFLRAYQRHLLTTEPRPRCDACSTFDDGSPVTPADEQELGVRCWAPSWALEFTPCPGCGEDVGRRIPYDDLPARCKLEGVGL